MEPPCIQDLYCAVANGVHHVRRYVIKIGVPPSRDGKESLFVPQLINSMAATAMNQEIVASLLLSSALGAATTPPLPQFPDLTAAAMYNSNNNNNTESNNNSECNIDNEGSDRKSNNNNNNANDNNTNNINESNIDNAVPPVVLAPLLLGNLIVPLAQQKLTANNDLGGSMTLAAQLEAAEPAAVGEGVPRGAMETHVAPKTSPVGAAHDGHKIV